MPDASHSIIEFVDKYTTSDRVWCEVTGEVDLSYLRGNTVVRGFIARCVSFGEYWPVYDLKITHWPGKGTGVSIYLPFAAPTLKKWWPEADVPSPFNEETAVANWRGVVRSFMTILQVGADHELTDTYVHLEGSCVYEEREWLLEGVSQIPKLEVSFA